MSNNDIEVIDVKSARLECPCGFNEVNNLVKIVKKSPNRVYHNYGLSIVLVVHLYRKKL